MNEFLRSFVMKTLLKMIDNNIPEWQVREYALGWYAKGVLTEEDLQEIEERYQPVEGAEAEETDTVDDTVDTVDTVESAENVAEESEVQE